MLLVRFLRRSSFSLNLFGADKPHLVSCSGFTWLRERRRFPGDEAREPAPSWPPTTPPCPGEASTSDGDSDGLSGGRTGFQATGWAGVE